MTEKLWGRSHPIFNDGRAEIVKIEVVKNGFSSRHFHREKENIFILESGVLIVRMYHGAGGQRDGDEFTDFTLEAGSDPHIVPVLWEHRFIAAEETVCLEVYRASGQRPVMPQDIVRRDEGGVLREGRNLV